MFGLHLGSEPLKSRRRLLFRAMHGAAKSAPGGVTALAVALGRSEVSVANALNPDVLDKTPSLDLFLSVFELLGNETVANVLMDGAGFTASRRSGEVLGGDVFARYLDLVNRSSDSLSSGADALRDGVLTERERLEWMTQLGDLRDTCADLMALLRGA